MKNQETGNKGSAHEIDSEIEFLQRRTGLRLDRDRVAALNKDLDNIDAIARRIREGLQRDDEPAFLFKVPR